MSHSAMTAGAALHALGQPTGHADDASSQCCEERPHRGCKRSAESSCDDSGAPGGAKRARRNYAYIEVHISNSANAPKPAAHPAVSMRTQHITSQPFQPHQADQIDQMLTLLKEGSLSCLRYALTTHYAPSLLCLANTPMLFP